MESKFYDITLQQQSSDENKKSSNDIPIEAESSLPTSPSSSSSSSSTSSYSLPSSSPTNKNNKKKGALAKRKISKIFESERENETQLLREYKHIITDDIKSIIRDIFQEANNYTKLWRIYSRLDKVLHIINFGILLYSICIPDNKISLILSLFTISYSSIFNNNVNLMRLDKIVSVYKDEILPKLTTRLHEFNVKYISKTMDPDACIICMKDIQKIEKDTLTRYLGQNYVISNNLRKLDFTKIIMCFGVYLVCFCLIPFMYTAYHASIGGSSSSSSRGTGGGGDGGEIGIGGGDGVSVANNATEVPFPLFVSSINNTTNNNFLIP